MEQVGFDPQRIVSSIHAQANNHIESGISLRINISGVGRSSQQGIDEHIFPQRMEIDWVRYYQQH
jgi:hypothetical protein